MTDTIESLPNQSQSPIEERVDRLRNAFPEVFREGKIDFDALKRSLGQQVDAGKERFGLSWPGKADCMRVIAEPSVGTLVPMRAESVQFDATGNVIIEGDNLEVLKILQKSYYGKIKLIYIDPPYNTANEFIYPDNFREGLQDYLRYSGQVDASGLPVSTAPEIAGRTHAKWLRMMYPRIFLSRNLLTEDGVILVSIDDKEVATLRLLMDEVFGEDALVAQFVWNNEGNVDQQSKIKGVHEYVLCYARDPDKVSRPSVIDPNIEETSKLFNDVIDNTLTKNGPANPVSTVLLPAGFPASFEDGDIAPRDDRWPHVLDTLVVRGAKLVAPARVASGWSSRNLLDLYIRNGFQPIEDSEGKKTWFVLTESGAIYVNKQRAAAQGHVLSVIRNVGTSKQTGSMLAAWGVNFSYPKPILLIEYRAAHQDIREFRRCNCNTGDFRLLPLDDRLVPNSALADETRHVRQATRL